MPTYCFTVTLSGTGDDIDEAWRDAVDALSVDPGPTPEDENIELVDEED